MCTMVKGVLRNLEKSKIIIRDIKREMASWVVGAPERMIEYSFAMKCCQQLVGKELLEIGGGESSLSYKLARRGFEVWVVDINPYSFKHRNIKFYREDIATIDLPDNYFDGIIAISTIEHIGMGWYGDSHDGNGDLLSMKKISNAVKKQGIVCITVPVAPTYREISGRTRIYDYKALNKLIHFSNLHINVLEYYMPTRKMGSHAFNWVKVTSNDIIDGSYLKIYPHAIACLTLVKNVSC